MKKLLYLSHPSGGLEENTVDIEKVIRKLYKNDVIYDNFCIVSPVHCYGFMYNDNPDLEYDYKGLSYCTDLLQHCDIMVVVGNWKESTGCREEVKLCKDINIPIIYIDNSDKVDYCLDNGLVNILLNAVR